MSQSEVLPVCSLPVVAIVGPTAVGKSDVADLVAEALDSEVISADSMQVYRRMDIGTAKVPECERRVPLRMVDVAEPAEAYSAALYQRDARSHIKRLIDGGRVPILCGGTGLYVRAALDVMEFPSGDIESSRRLRYQGLAEELGEDGLHALLERRDPRSASCIHPHNVRRVIRALEMLDDGVSYADQKAGFSAARPWCPSIQFGLTMDRAALYARIDARVDRMFAAGLVDEVRRLLDEGAGDALTSRQAIGYKEVIEALCGAITLDEARELIKQRSRRYAKRQVSWFKRDSRVSWIDMDSHDSAQAAQIVLQAVGEWRA